MGKMLAIRLIQAIMRSKSRNVCYWETGYQGNGL